MNEAELVLSDLLGCSKLTLYLNRHSPMEKLHARVLASVLRRRMSGEPLQYILGRTEFMGFGFVVNRNVLIPRPETEILVEAALRVSSCCKPPASALNILDIGTGSGCIAVSLAKLLPDTYITAIDISPRAIAVARYNAVLHNVADNITFMESDLFAACNVKPAVFDLIISNPPYIRSCEIETLQPEIQHEPQIALDGGKDGLDFYRRIIHESSRYLTQTGLLIMEMGLGQDNDIELILRRSGVLKKREVIRDYNGIARVIIVQRTGVDYG